MKPLATLVLATLVGAAASAAAPAAAQAAAQAELPLIEAVLKGDRAAVQRLLRQHADVNAANDYGATALYAASTTCSVDLIGLLLDARANPNAPLRSGETPLMAAVDNGFIDAARLLLARGADVNARESKGGQTALMWAAAGRQPEVVRLLVDRGADVRARSTGGFTALLFAAQQDDVESGRLLLQAGAGTNDTSAGDRMTALMVAAASGHVGFSELMLEKGADPNLADERGFTALHYAASDEKGAGLVRALFSHGAVPNPRTTKDSREYVTAGVNLTGATPLLLASARGNIETVRALVAGGADPFMKTDHGTAPLQVASWGGSPYFRDWTDDEKTHLLEVT
ncbi:MAG: ankyrin repeat domain-containing protein, partial [Acidobacteria bacterium]|nr:ankyrin repeat domain-containing protein [Acidobacteriota bacterium]